MANSNAKPQRTLSWAGQTKHESFQIQLERTPIYTSPINSTISVIRYPLIVVRRIDRDQHVGMFVHIGVKIPNQIILSDTAPRSSHSTPTPTIPDSNWDLRITDKLSSNNLQTLKFLTIND